MKIKWGALVTAGSGKLGGHVAAKNRAGSYFRTRVTPVNPATSDQARSRNRFGGLSQAWRTLSEAARTAWNSAVSDFARTDIFGDLKNPSGFNLFQRLNNNLLNVGQEQLSAPPTVGSTFALKAFALIATPASLSVDFFDDIPATARVILSATAPVSAGVNFVSSEYRQIAILDETEVTPFDATAAYVAKFGSLPAAGRKVFIRARVINLPSGLASPDLTASAIVA